MTCRNFRVARVPRPADLWQGLWAQELFPGQDDKAGERDLGGTSDILGCADDTTTEELCDLVN